MNNNQLNFVAQYLRHRDACTAYCLAYNLTDCSDYVSIMSAANKLMDDPEVGGLIDSVLSNVRYDVEQQIRAEQRTELLTVQRKREILTRIATGDMFIPQNYKGKDCTQCTQMVTPTINQMLKAIDIDNRMAGHYSGGKGQLTVDSPQLPKPENSTQSQQNTTKAQSPLPGRVANPDHNPQPTNFQKERPIPGRGLGEAPPQSSTNNPPKEQQNTTSTYAGSTLVAPFREDRRVSPPGQEIHEANYNKTQQVHT